MRDRAEEGKGLRRLLAGVLLLFLLDLGAAASQQREPEEDPAADPTAGVARYDARIRDLALRSEGGAFVSDLRLTGAFIGEVKDRIDSGLEVTFKYTLELMRKKVWWFDRRIARREVVTRVVRDTLAGRYILSRDIDGEEVARTSTEDPEAVRRWLATLEAVPLLPVAELEREEGDEESRLLLRARAKVRDDFILLFIPWDFETGWERVVAPLGEILGAPGPEGRAEGEGAPGAGSD
jgi:hypothetical protein